MRKRNIRILPGSVCSVQKIISLLISIGKSSSEAISDFRAAGKRLFGNMQKYGTYF